MFDFTQLAQRQFFNVSMWLQIFRVFSKVGGRALKWTGIPAQKILFIHWFPAFLKVCPRNK